MINTKEYKELVCDWCDSKVSVRSYKMETKQFDGYDRNEYVTDHIELCASCQVKAFDMLKDFKVGK